MKIQIKTDEVSKDTKNHLKFRKNLRKMLMQRKENRKFGYKIERVLNSLNDFDPVLDWEFRPICGCEVTGMEEAPNNIRHHKLFNRSGHLLFDELISGYSNDVCVIEGYEVWVLEDMSLVFIYCCAYGFPECEEMMFYRYPLGRKIPTNMDLDIDNFLEKIEEKVYCARAFK